MNENWTRKNVEEIIKKYATQNGLKFGYVTTQQNKGLYGTTTAYIYDLGDKSVVMVDTKVAGSPSMNDFKVHVGTMVEGNKLINAHSVSKYGSWGVHKVVDMLDKVFKK